MREGDRITGAVADRSGENEQPLVGRVRLQVRRVDRQPGDLAKRPNRTADERAQAGHRGARRGHVRGEQIAVMPGELAGERECQRDDGDDVERRSANASAFSGDPTRSGGRSPPRPRARQRHGRRLCDGDRCDRATRPAASGTPARAHGRCAASPSADRWRPRLPRRIADRRELDEARGAVEHRAAMAAAHLTGAQGELRRRHAEHRATAWAARVLFIHRGDAQPFRLRRCARQRGASSRRPGDRPRV